MSCVIVENSNNLSFFIDGNLQFDSRDEALYHESLALPGLCLLKRRGIQPIRVLICGGGDGLALRDCLRFPDVASVDLVDISEEVIELGRTRFSALNQRSFSDKRVKVHICDAWELSGAGRDAYDLILCDFTFPTCPEDARLLSVEWFERVRCLLTPDGIAAINAVSPDKTPEAFWCVANSIKAAGLKALPYRVCIPSFRQMGYGTWGFMLASPVPLSLGEFRQMECPVACSQADISRLWRGARFSRAERAKARAIPTNRGESAVLMDFILNPGERPVPADDAELPSLEALMSAIPISHPYHTREMIRTLAEQVVGTVKSIDLHRLVDEILARGHRLSERLRFELSRLKEFLRTNFSLSGSWHEWSAKLFATLIIVLTLANTLSPENAFAKGHMGLGHSSISRGSFGRTGSFRSLAAPERGALTGTGFRSTSLGTGGPVDIYGYRYTPRVYRYYDFSYWPSNYYSGAGGYYGGTSNQSAPPPQNHQSVFVADDDMVVTDSGDVIITLSDDAFLVARQGTLTLVSQSNGPLMPIHPDSNLFRVMWYSLDGQKTTALLEQRNRLDWLSWTGWTSALFETVRQDKLEVENLADLAKRLDRAMQGLGTLTDQRSLEPPPDSTEVFVGCYALSNKSLVIQGPDGEGTVVNGSGMTTPQGKTQPLPKPLKDTLTSILNKVIKEVQADVASCNHDLTQDDSDYRSCQNDLQQYQQIYQQNGMDPTYSVDYGTDEVPVLGAIQRTQADMQNIEADARAAQTARDKAAADVARLQGALDAISSAS